VFEEKMLFALLWNRNLREFWRQNSARILQPLLKAVPTLGSLTRRPCRRTPQS